MGDYLFPEDMPGYIGAAYNFSVEGDFDTARISFEFDPTLLPEGAKPIIYYFNETEQELEAQETTIEGNVASTVVEHFSTYILVESTGYNEAFECTDTWNDTGKYDSVEIVFVVDDSESMVSNDPNYTRLGVACDLISALPEKSKIGVVWFASSVRLLTSELITDKFAAKQLLSPREFKSSGGTYMYSAINKAFDLFAATDETTLRVMVVLSDGSTSDTGQHTNCVLKAQEKGIKIYTVGLGNSTSYFNNYMRPLAERTGECIDRRLSSDPFTREYYDGEGKLHGRIYVGQDTKEELDWNVKWYGSMGRDEKGHIPEAESIPYSEEPDFLEKFEKKNAIVICCDRGNLSAKVTLRMRKAGYPAYSLAGGYEGYKRFQK